MTGRICGTGSYIPEKVMDNDALSRIVDKSEYQRLMNYMNNEDPKAFVTVYHVSDMRYQPKR